MTGPAKFLSGRQIALFLFMLVLLLGVVYAWQRITTAVPVHAWDKQAQATAKQTPATVQTNRRLPANPGELQLREYSALVWNGTWAALPLAAAIALIFTQAFSFSLLLRKGSTIRNPESLSLAEFVSPVVGFCLLVSLAVLLFQVFALPAVLEGREAVLSRPDRKYVPEQDPEKNAFLTQAIDLYYEGKFREALAKLRVFRKEYPENVLGRLYARYARQELQAQGTGKEQDFSGEPALFRQGYRLYRQGKLLQAIERFNKVLRVAPNHVRSKRYLALAMKAVKRGRMPHSRLQRREGVRIDLLNAVRRGRKLFEANKYWECYRVMQSVLAVDEYNAVARDYVNRAREKIRRFDFFLEEFRYFHLYLARSDVLLPLGKGRWLVARWLFRRKGTLYLRFAWILEQQTATDQIRMIRAEFGKWIGKNLILRRVRIHVRGATGTWQRKSLRRMPVVVATPQDQLWQCAGFLYGEKQLAPMQILALIGLFKRHGLPLSRLQQAFSTYFSLPLVMFCLSLLAAAAGWRNRSLVRGRVGVAEVVFVPACLIIAWIVVVVGERLLLGLQLLASPQPVLAYLVPIASGLAMAGLSVTVLVKSR